MTSRATDRVIVAIPTRNRAPLLQRAVESVLSQDHERITVLISDNCSTDDTPRVCRELAASDDRVVVHRQQRNLGLTGNYNWLMRRAITHSDIEHSYFMFLSDDDWLEQNYVSACINVLVSTPEASLVAGRTVTELDSTDTHESGKVNLTADSSAERLWDFCQDVLPTGVFSGVMPLDVVHRLPSQRNVLGHDWILLANIAVLGKIVTCDQTAIHRDTEGVSTSLTGLARTLGISTLQARRPLVTIAFYMIAECLRRSPVMARFPAARRLHLASVVLFALFCRKAVPYTTSRSDRRIARLLHSGLRSSRRWILRLDPAPVPRTEITSWPASDLESVPVCPACGSHERRPMHTALPDQVFAIAGGRWDLHRCGACDAAFLDPRPASDANERAYGAGYYTHASTLLPPDLTDGMRGLRLRSRNAYINRRYGYELEPAPSLGLPLAYARPRSRAADDRVFRHLPRPRRGARLLDVGCGSGAFVARAIALGWNAQGIDNDEAAVRAGQAAGLPLSTTPIEELAVSMRGSFDAVTMAHVIEHVPHPVTFLGAARALLRDSGTLWLATPNLDSSGHRRFGERWMHLDPPRHLVLFGQLAIDRALGSAGFEILSTPSSASGTIASYAQSSRIAQGRLPISDSRVPPLVRAGGLAAGLRSLLQSTLSEELIRLARPRTGR